MVVATIAVTARASVFLSTGYLQVLVGIPDTVTVTGAMNAG
jgi:hypothetical protein